MNRYLVETNHTGKDCSDVLRRFADYGYITHFDWGCESGVHTGWAIIEADNETEAMMSVPSLLRLRSRVVGLTKFSPESIQKLHEGLSE
jgi:hypothetical protein